jgi:hypothetical protein
LPAALLALCTALFHLLLPAARADESNVKVHLEAVNTDKLPMLKTYVTLVDSDGKPVRANSGYKLMLDQVEQKDVEVQFTSFQEAKEPIDVVAVVQLSPVMEPALARVREALTKFAKALAKHNHESRLAIIGYASEVKRLEEFGRPSEIARDLDRLKIEQEASEVRMVEALRVAIDLCREHPDRRRRIVLFSDGIDGSQGKEAFADVARRAQQAGVVIDSVGFAPFEPGRLRSLIEISRVSAGTARGCKSPDEIASRYALVAEGIFSSGVVTFGLTTSGDNAQHAVQVAFKAGREDAVSEAVNVQLPPFEPADPAGHSWQFWLAVIGGGLFGLLVLLFIIGKIMGG